jgi:signal transduction histidine kinase
MQNKPFLAARLRLAISYTGVMSLILMICSLAIYRLITHARWLSLNQEMDQMATVVGRQINPALNQVGAIDAQGSQYLLGLCWAKAPCTQPSGVATSASSNATELLEQLVQNDFCVRFLTAAYQPVAFVRMPEPDGSCNGSNFWEKLTNQQGDQYRPNLYPLYTPDQQKWGYLQLAKSIDALDIYLFWIELTLMALLVLATLLAGASSWWLAGMALQPVREAYQQMEQFTADAAHELRTPLTALRTMVQAALRAETLAPQEVQATLQTVNRQSQRLSKLVQDLLLLCQTAQATTQGFQPCCLNAVVNELEDDFMAIALAAELTLSVERTNAEIGYVWGDQEQFYRAIANLLSNAIHHTPEGGRVTLRLYALPRMAIIQVQDTGIGIAPEHQAQIFNRFYRVERARSQDRGGTGLGLSIVQSIVQRHRGTLTVESELGKGSTFTIQLPLAN